MDDQPSIEHKTIIEDLKERRRLWEFYDRIFQPVNAESPRLQTWPKKNFMSFLRDPDVVKIVATEGGNIVGLGIITGKMSADPWLSQTFFKKQFPGAPVFNILCLAVNTNYRKDHLAYKLLREMLNGLPENGVGVFFVSERINHALPVLAERAMRRTIEGRPMDQETCWVYRMKGQPFPEGRAVELVDLP